MPQGCYLWQQVTRVIMAHTSVCCKQCGEQSMAHTLGAREYTLPPLSPESQLNFIRVSAGAIRNAIRRTDALPGSQPPHLSNICNFCHGFCFLTLALTRYLQMYTGCLGALG